MKRFVLLLVMILVACDSLKKKDASPLADINLFTSSTKKIDSVFFSNVSQDREFQFLPYKDVIRIDLNDSINDLYTFTFFYGKERKMGQLWLDGSAITINGRFDEFLRIDTVIGSELYYISKDFRTNFQRLLRSEGDSADINRFLLKEMRKNLANPFSVEIADNYLRRNLNDQEALKKLFALQVLQKDEIKSHWISSYKKVEQLLRKDKIDLSTAGFLDRNNKLTALNLEKEKIYLLDFWFVKCKPCILDHQLMLAQQEFLRSKQINIISLSIDQDYKEWDNYLSKNDLLWPQFREVEEFDRRLSAKEFISTYPTYLLIRGDGQILYRSNEYTSVKNYISENDRSQ